MMKRFLHAIAVVALTAFWPHSAHAQNDIIGLEAFDGRLDIRASVVGGEPGWLDGGFGKLREGGKDGETEPRLTLAAADLAWKPRFSWNLTGLVSITHQRELSNDVDISEAYIEFRSDPAPTRFAVRAGAMWPPVSMEHSGSNWEVTDSITPSAANSWIGEEIKVLAFEASVERSFGEHELKLTAATFLHNDLSGTLLFYRGWSLNDFRVTVDAEHPLPPLAPASADKQDRISTTFWELDDRAGYYARIDYTPPLPVTFNLFRYDNLGDHVSTREKQIQWLTRFWNFGVAARLDEQTVAKAQVMWGNTAAGAETPLGLPGDMDFATAYLLVSRDIGDGRLTVRGDWFETTDNTYVAENNNNEEGWSAMAAYKHPVTDFADVVVELIHVDSDRPGRALYGNWAAQQSQTMFQTAVRLSF